VKAYFAVLGIQFKSVLAQNSSVASAPIAPGVKKIAPEVKKIAPEVKKTAP
jgi:hypothetical protein